MEAQVTVTLPDRLYHRVQSLAQVKRRQMAETILEHLEAAYLRLHPQLKVSHCGRYVAIDQGALIDADDTFGALVERVRRELPNQVVWLTQVKEEPIQTIVKRRNRQLCHQW